MGLVTVACAPYALSPPARTLPLESAATMAPRRVGVQAGVGYHGSIAEEGPTATVRARVGLTPSVECDLEGGYAFISYDDERSPHLGAGRAGIKVAPWRHLAFLVGLGGGTHTHGPFVAPDVGVIVAYENPVLVPWMAVRATMSVAVDPVAVVVNRTRGGFSGPTVESYVLVPPNTASWQIATGARLPIAIDDGALRSVDLLVGGAYIELRSVASDDSLSVGQVQLGLQANLE